MKKQANRKVVTLDKRLYNELKDYSDHHGYKIYRVVDNAIEQYLHNRWPPERVKQIQDLA